MNHCSSLLLALSCSFVLPAIAQETLVAPFTTQSNATSLFYFGTVRVQVSGTGFSLGSNLNDAFYNVPSGAIDSSGCYQLAFATAPITGSCTSPAFAFVVGGRPAYQASHFYDFVLNTDLTAPGRLYFGVTDGNYSDNGGSFTITVSPVPEVASWAMMGLGLAAVSGVFGVRRQHASTGQGS